MNTLKVLAICFVFFASVSAYSHRIHKHLDTAPDNNTAPANNTAQPDNSTAVDEKLAKA
jgi:uncharacterized membrane protein